MYVNYTSQNTLNYRHLDNIIIFLDVADSREYNTHGTRFEIFGIPIY